MLFVNNNGNVLSNDGPTLQAGNRGHLYGDGVFESIRIVSGVPINLENHVKRMLEGAKTLKIKTPTFYDTAFFHERIMELLAKSGINEGGKCRISIDRMSGGSYKPEVNDATFFIEVYPLEQNTFDLNSKGFEIDIFTELKKQRNSLSNFKHKSAIVYVMAAIKAGELKLDDLLIVNDNGGILETSNSNLFVVSNGVLYTPGLEEGCLAGTMRMQIINLALKNGIKVYECNILPQNLLAADEIFLTNAIKGIVWVGGYRTKRYFNNSARKFVAYLNDYWESQIDSIKPL